MRLDIYLYENGFFGSREKARQSVLDGGVCVNDKIIKKPSFGVTGNDDIKIVKETNPFVGRGGSKLQAALDYFNIDVRGAAVLDIGASTGGFTDCMLKNGAARVYACDVGNNQLAPILKNDGRVISLENTDIRDLASAPEKYGIKPGENIKFGFITIDVSFISITKILPVIKTLLSPETKIICLIKPQFEIRDTDIKMARRFFKKGIVKSPEAHEKICENIRKVMRQQGYAVSDIIESPVTGGDGNKEFLAVLEYPGIPGTTASHAENAACLPVEDAQAQRASLDGKP